MRILLVFAFFVPLFAQDKPKEAAPAAAPAPSPAPSSDNWLTGYIDLGERWRTGVGGSLATYRSVVDLSSGPKMLGADFTILDVKRRLIDRIRVRAHNWGDDPYESLHVLVEKQDVYEFNADYRRVAYFNNLPSYADPLLNRGITRNEQSFDTRRTLGSFTLDILPSKMFSPYIAYDRDSSRGTGVSVLQTGGNEFAIPAGLSDSTNLYRSGVHITGSKFHVTLEEGGTTFRNDQNTFTGATAANNTTLLLGQTISLSSLLQDYGIRGNGTFSKVIVTANPFSWIDIYGHFLFSEPRTDVNYKQFNNGNFVLLNQLLFYTSEQYLVAAAAKLPHTSGDVGIEIRPMAGVRILESWMTDRLHNATAAKQADTLLSTGSSTFIGTQLQQSLATNYNQNETSVIAEVSKNLTLRGGYRYVWGDERNAVLPQEGLITLARETLRRNVGLGAANWHVNKRATLIAELEAGSSTGVYFRTSLYNYTKFRTLGRYQLTDSLRLSADYTVLTNHNPNLESSYKYLTHQESVSLGWNPAGKKFDAQASYEHCGYHSEISYLQPQILAAANSIYNENCHTISGLFRYAYKKVEASGGGAVALTSGSRPTAYYQPLAKVSYRVARNLALFAEWRYYGLGESFYLYEGFRAHLFTTGLRFSR